jgi:transcriptional regulator of aromatic amino acid metabolism
MATTEEWAACRARCALLQSILDALEESVVATDAAGQTIFANAAAVNADRLDMIATKEVSIQIPVRIRTQHPTCCSTESPFVACLPNAQSFFIQSHQCTPMKLMKS